MLTPRYDAASFTVRGRSSTFAVRLRGSSFTIWFTCHLFRRYQPRSNFARGPFCRVLLAPLRGRYGESGNIFYGPALSSSPSELSFPWIRLVRIIHGRFLLHDPHGEIARVKRAHIFVEDLPTFLDGLLGPVEAANQRLRGVNRAWRTCEREHARTA